MGSQSSKASPEGRTAAELLHLENITDSALKSGSKTFFKKVQKPLDKPLNRWYNQVTVKQAERTTDCKRTLYLENSILSKCIQSVSVWEYRRWGKPPLRVVRPKGNVTHGKATTKRHENLKCGTANPKPTAD